MQQGRYKTNGLAIIVADDWLNVEPVVVVQSDDGRGRKSRIFSFEIVRNSQSFSVPLTAKNINAR